MTGVAEVAATDVVEAAEENLYPFAETWTGDLDAMTQRRVIRLLTVYSLGRYYLKNGEEKGLVREVADVLQEYINKRLERRHVLVHVVVIPVARDQLLPALLAGRGGESPPPALNPHIHMMLGTTPLILRSAAKASA